MREIHDMWQARQEQPSTSTSGVKPKTARDVGAMLRRKATEGLHSNTAGNK